MTPVLFALLAILLYAPMNVVMERRLSHLDPLSILLVSYPVMFGCILLARAAQGAPAKTAAVPTDYLIAAGAGVLWFLADWCYIQAYHAKGSAVAVTTVAVLLPAAAAVVSLLWSGNLPAPRQVLAWVLAAVVVVLAKDPAAT
ncbi:MAG: hypothetical protein HY369_01450 [Candidatus Aenigmarchaeota archaeon]|nr:hypothetical protein [Candidatus Aenigmarchaeota archaeon]